MAARLQEKTVLNGVSKDDISVIKDPTYENLVRLSLQYSDAAIHGSSDLPDNIVNIIKESGKPNLDYMDPEKYIEEYSVFYENILNRSFDLPL